MSAILDGDNQALDLKPLCVLREVKNQNCPRWVTVEDDDIPHYQAKGDRIEEVVSKAEAEKAISSAEGAKEASKDADDLEQSLNAAKTWLSLTVPEMRDMMETAEEEIDACLGNSELTDP
ncbi:hypothetical protein [Acetobacter persici]|uniref:Uncharacterized protein n=1 Tax=Acetobacter persici TaxID=1076596 RepID=A0A1U9LJ36_9PROT|nr:hypothetical protein [Acetobacter persici]AQT06465.1 hypothetical protein A0U91_15745 [Acetobacter persici]